MTNIVYEPSKTTHWRNLFESKSMLLGSHNLNEGEELVAQIHAVGIQDIKDQNGKTEKVPVITFTNAPPMVLNITNSQTIESMYGPYSHNWVGKYIQIFATEVKAFGKKQLALRIRQKIPTTGSDTSEYEAKLRECQTIEELQSEFMSLPRHLKGALTKVKNEMKGKLNV